jgi:hypothetical protein
MTKALSKLGKDISKRIAATWAAEIKTKASAREALWLWVIVLLTFGRIA